ncbi:histidine kinase dimerization/phospho-acceptor domain-containing protein, partial [Candidatus Margulisiibacteriota bacterium]
NDLNDKTLLHLHPNDPIIEFFKNKSILKNKEVVEGIRTRFSCLSFKKPLFVCLRCNTQFLGLLILDQKISEAPFDKKDICFMKRISCFLQTLFERAQPYEEIEAELKNTLQIGTINKTIITLNHEINSPLTAILISAQQLTKELKNNPKNERLADIILQGTQKVRNIIFRLRKLTTFSDEEYLPGITMFKLDNKNE